MTRLAGRLWDCAAATALLLCVVMAVLWARSFYRWDTVAYSNVFADRGGAVAVDYSLGVHDGRVVVVGSVDAYGLAKDESIWNYRESLPHCTWATVVPPPADTSPYSPGLFGKAPTRSWYYDVSLPGVMAVLAIVPALGLTAEWIGRRRGRQRKREGLCLRCGYDLRASPEICPECGTPVGVAPVARAPLWQRWSLAGAVGGMVILGTVGTGWACVQHYLRPRADAWLGAHLTEFTNEMLEAAAGGNKLEIEAILEKGVPINTEDDQGRTVLMVAVANDSNYHIDPHDKTELARFLIKNGADVGRTDHVGRTPLHYAASDGPEELIELLIASGADVRAVDQGGQTPLHVAASGDNRPVASLLLDHGANVNAVDGNMRTPLHCAVGGSQAVVNLLLDRGASINALDQWNRTPLRYAELLSKPGTAKLLIERGGK